MATKKKLKSKRVSKPSTPKLKRRIPRQNALPGMENSRIAAIETAALDYAEIRDQRQDLTTQESSLKTELLTLMHKEGKTEYKRGNITVKVVTEKENVKVRVKEEGESADVAVDTEGDEEVADAVGAA